MTKKQLTIITAVVAVIILGVSGFVLLGGKAPKAASKNTPKKTMDIRSVEKGDVVKSISAEGQLKTSALTEVKIPVAGIIEKVNVKAGAMVRKGDVLATINKEDLLKQLQKAKDDLQKKMTEAGEKSPSKTSITIKAPQAGKIKTNNLRRKKSLADIKKSGEAIVLVDSDDKVIAIDMPDNGVITYVNSRAKAGRKVKKGTRLFTISVPTNDFDKGIQAVQEQKKIVAMYEALIKDPVLRAEDEAIVGEVQEVVGKPSEKDTLVLNLQPMKDFSIKVSVTQDELSKVKNDQEAEINLGDQTVKGKVEHISYKANEEGKFGIVVVMTEAPKVRVLPGTKCTVSVILDQRKDVVRVPVGAVKEDDKGEYVMLYTGSESTITEQDTSKIPMEKRYIQRGLTNTMNAEVISGLKAGDKVVVIKTSNMDDMYGDMNGGGMDFMGSMPIG